MLIKLFAERIRPFSSERKNSMADLLEDSFCIKPWYKCAFNNFRFSLEENGTHEVFILCSSIYYFHVEFRQTIIMKH